MRFAASPAFLKRLATFAADNQGRIAYGKQVDAGLTEAKYGKTFARMLQANPILGAGANGIVVQPAANANTVLKLQTSRSKDYVLDEASATAKASELGYGPRVHSVEFSPDGTSIIEMEKLPINSQIRTREKDLLSAQAQLDLIDQGIIHKDIHPGNIAYDPAAGSVRFIDFGAASTSASPVSTALHKTSAIVEGMQAMGNTEEAEIFRGLVTDLLTEAKLQRQTAGGPVMDSLSDLIQQGQQIVASAVDDDLGRPYTTIAKGDYPNAPLHRLQASRFRAPPLGHH